MTDTGLLQPTLTKTWGGEQQLPVHRIKLFESFTIELASLTVQARPYAPGRKPGSPRVPGRFRFHVEDVVSVALFLLRLRFLRWSLLVYSWGGITQSLHALPMLTARPNPCLPNSPPLPRATGMWLRLLRLPKSPLSPGALRPGQPRHRPPSASPMWKTNLPSLLRHAPVPVDLPASPARAKLYTSPQIARSWTTM
jgi:hypothetical protein